MKRLIWKPNGKNRCIRHLAANVSASFSQTLEWVEKNHERYPLAKPSVDASGHLDGIFEEYAYNTEWASKKQIDEVIFLALQDAYSAAQSKNKEPDAFMIWLAAQIKEMRDA